MSSRIDRWRIGILFVSLIVSSYHLNWGLPNGNRSWAADALGPATALGVVSRSFADWNSGWFYFKYPLGHPLLLAVTYVPYLGYLLVTGGWRAPTSTYPYGFADPERALFVLAMCGRMLSVLLAIGTVALTYAIGERLGGKQAGRLSAWFVATCYPVVYYAHTTNIDEAYLFWLILALYCALAAGQTDDWLPWGGLGLAAAMAVATKEQAFAFLLPLPFLVLLSRGRVHGGVRVCWSRPTLVMVGTAIAVAAVATNALFNPMGFVSRMAFVLGRPLQPVAVRLLPVEFAWFKGAKEWQYLSQLWDGVESAFGTLLALLVAAGAVAILRRPRAAGWLLVPVVAYYYLSLRGMELIALRYLLPLLVVAAVLAALLIEQLDARMPTKVARIAVRGVVLTLALLALARAIELDLLLETDARYQAEAWLEEHLPVGASGEVYQKPTYLPRFRKRWPVSLVPMEARTVHGIREREPDFIVLSSISRRSMFSVWNPDWRSTRTLLLREPEAARMIEAIENGSLGYRRAAVFAQRPRLIRSRITSLCPEISIYVRESHSRTLTYGDRS